MAIKPLDLQVMLPRTAEISKIAYDQQHKNITLQQQQAASLQDQAEANTRQVHSQDEVQHARIGDKQEKGRGNSGEDSRKKKREQTKNEESRNSNPQIRTSTIDIRL